MADKRISELVAAEQVEPDDLFVLEQSGEAKKMTGKILKETIKETIKENPAEVFPLPTEIEVEETGDTATIVTKFPDGKIDNTVFTFDGNGYATNVNVNGTDVPVSWVVT